MVLHLAKKIIITTPPLKSEESLKHNIKQANQHWKDIKKTASNQRDTFMEGLADARAQAGGAT